MSKNIKISNKLINLGMNPKTNGFIYWIEIYSFYKNKKNKKIYIEKIYLKLAKKYGKTRNAIERNVRYAKNSCILKIKEEYRFDDKITNKTFLKLLLNRR